jgi:hypothetical protein
LGPGVATDGVGDALDDGVAVGVTVDRFGFGSDVHVIGIAIIIVNYLFTAPHPPNVAPPGKCEGRDQIETLEVLY